MILYDCLLHELRKTERINCLGEEREAVVKRSDMSDPRVEPNFGFDFLDQNRLVSVEFDSQGRGEGEKERKVLFTLSLFDLSSLFSNIVISKREEKKWRSG